MTSERPHPRDAPQAQPPPRQVATDVNAASPWALTVLLFLAWNVPVAAVQAIVRSSA